MFVECNELKYAYLLFSINPEFSLFNKCNNLENVLFDENIKKLPMYTFNVCKSLTKIESLKRNLTIIEGMPNIDEIGEFAFNYCSSMINIPTFWDIIIDQSSLIDITVINNFASSTGIIS